MSLEQQLEALTTAVSKLTDAISARGATTSVSEPGAEPKKSTRGKAVKTEPKKEPELVNTDLDDLEPELPEVVEDDMGLGLDDEPAAPKVDGPTLKSHMSSLAKAKGRDAALGVFKKFGANTFDGLKAADYDKIYAEVSKLLGE